VNVRIDSQERVGKKEERLRARRGRTSFLSVIRDVREKVRIHFIGKKRKRDELKKRQQALLGRRT